MSLELSKYSDNKKKFYELSGDERFRNRSNEFVVTINEMSKTSFSLNTKGGTVDMCEGLKELCKDYFDEGKQQGFAEGEAKGISETTHKFEEVLRNKGISEELIRSICSEVKNIK